MLEQIQKKKREKEELAQKRQERKEALEKALNDRKQERLKFEEEQKPKV